MECVRISVIQNSRVTIILAHDELRNYLSYLMDTQCFFFSNACFDGVYNIGSFSFQCRDLGGAMVAYVTAVLDVSGLKPGSG